MTHTRKITIKNYLAYGAGDLYGGGAFFIVTTFSMYYLVNVVGMHPVLAGLIPAIGKIWDAVSDPLMGYISDNTRENRFGKRRVWFLISILPIAVTFALIWFPIGIASQMGKFFFYLFTYMLFFTVATMSYIPYAALSAEMTYDRKERNDLNGSRIFFSFVSTLLAGVAVKPIIDFYDGNKTGYLVMGLIFGLIFALPWITLYLGTWEVPQQKRKVDDANFIVNFLSLFKSRSCRIHVAMYVCAYGTMDVFMAWIMFYFIDYLEMGSYFVLAQGSLLITMMLMLPLYVKIATEKGHALSYKIGLSLFAVGMIGFAFQPPHPSLLLLVLNVIVIGAGLSAASLIPHQLLPFVVDVDKLMSGKDRAGTYSAVMTLTRKLFLGIVILQGLGFLLGAIDYKNPVPTVLTASQFNEALTLIQENSDEKNYEEELYTIQVTNAFRLEKDGNYHLNNFSQKKETVILKSLSGELLDYYKKMMKEKGSINSLPVNLFEDIILPSFDCSDTNQMRKTLYLLRVFEKSGDRYVYNIIRETEGQLSPDAVYKLREVLDDIGFLYSGIGDQRKLSQKSETVEKLRFYFILFPLVMSIAGILIATRFRLSPKNHNIVIEELKRLDDGGLKRDVPEETRKICELVTGHPYEKLYN